MPFIDDDFLKTRLRTTMGKLAAGEGAFDEQTWVEVITDSNLFAQNEITAALVGRGFTAAQAAAWDRAQEFNIDLGLWRSLIVGGVYSEAGQDAKAFIDALDRREELKTALVLIGGEEPEEEDPLPEGPIRSGPLENATDIFRVDDKW